MHPTVAPGATDRRVRKEACDAFHETELQAVLDELGARHLVADGHGTSDSDGLPASQIIAHHNRTLNGYSAHVGRRACEIIVAPAETIQFDRVRDVPSSLEQRPLR